MSDSDTASASKSSAATELLLADSIDDSATGGSIGLSAYGVSKTLDIAGSDPSVAAGKSVKSVEPATAESSDTAESSTEGSDVHDLGATSPPYISSGLADTASVSPRQTIQVIQVRPQPLSLRCCIRGDQNSWFRSYKWYRRC